MKKSDENTIKPKKKGVGCCGCLAIFCLVFIVILGSGVGVGWYFADKYVRATFDLSLSETIGVVSSLYGADREKIITNAPGADDENNFYSAVEKQLYLKEGTLDADTLTALTGALTNAETGTAADAQIAAVRLAAADDDAAGALSNLLCQDNIDVQGIRAKFTDEYDLSGNYNEDFVVVLTDRQLLSFVRQMAEPALKEAEAPGIENLALEQLMLSRSTAGNPCVSLTAGVPVRETVGSIDQIPSWAAGILKAVAPKEIFITVNVELGDTISSGFVINNMNAEKQENVYKIITGVLKLTGSEVTDAREFLNNMAETYAGAFIKAADTYLDFDKNVSAGEIKFDIFSALASTVFEGKDISGPELASLYTSVLAADTEKMLSDNSELLFEDKYLVGGEEIYSPVPVEGADVVDYREEFMREFRTKYLIRTEFYSDGDKAYHSPAWKNEEGVVYVAGKLNFAGGVIPEENGLPKETVYRSLEEPYEVTGEIPDGNFEQLTLLPYISLSFDDVAALMGVGDSDIAVGIDLSELFDPTLLSKKMGGEESADKSQWFINQSDETIKFNLTDKMLAALIDAQVKSVFGSDTGQTDGNTLSDGVKLKFVSLSVGPEETIEFTESDGADTALSPSARATVKRKYVTMGIIVNVGNIYGGLDFVSGLAGDKLGLIVKMDITPELADKYLSAPSLKYADLSGARTDEMIEALKKAGLNDFSAESLTDKIGKPVREAIIKMNDTLGGVEIAAGKLVVPDVFSLLAKQLFKYDESKTYNGEAITLSGSEIHNALRGVYDLPPTCTVGEDGAEKTYLTADDGSYNRVYNESDSDYFDRDNDVVTVDKLNSLISGGTAGIPAISIDLRNLVGYYDGGSSSAGGEDVMYFTFEYELSRYLEGERGDTSLLVADTVYATFKVNKAAVNSDSYETVMTVNNMSADQRVILEKMITYFDADSEGEFSRLEMQIGRLAYYIDNFSAAL